MIVLHDCFVCFDHVSVHWHCLLYNHLRFKSFWLCNNTYQSLFFFKAKLFATTSSCLSDNLGTVRAQKEVNHSSRMLFCSFVFRESFYDRSSDSPGNINFVTFCRFLFFLFPPLRNATYSKHHRVRLRLILFFPTKDLVALFAEILKENLLKHESNSDVLFNVS